MEDSVSHPCARFGIRQIKVMCPRRGGERDLFPQYAAEGCREGLARVYNHALPSAPYGPEFESKVCTAHLRMLDAERPGQDHSHCLMQNKATRAPH